MWEKRVVIISGCHNRALFHYKTTESCIKKLHCEFCCSTFYPMLFQQQNVCPHFLPKKTKRKRMSLNPVYTGFTIYTPLHTYPCKPSLFLLCPYTAPYTIFSLWSILSISFKTNSILHLPLCPLHFSFIYLFFI